MSAQIIPFPVARARSEPEPDFAISLDPAFRAWCAMQNDRARELGLPFTKHAELKARYLRGER